jgi:hypothetical protein
MIIATIIIKLKHIVCYISISMKIYNMITWPKVFVYFIPLKETNISLLYPRN